MPLITLRQVSIHFAHHNLLESVDLSIEPGERTCLVGRNGAGKSTLFKLLLKQLQPESGEVVYQSGLKVTALEQEVPTELCGSVFQVVSDGLGEMGHVLGEYEALSMKPDHDDKSLNELQKLQDKIDHGDGWTLQSQVSTVLTELDLDGQLQFEDLSGGLKRRVLLARALVNGPDLLLLDEPTNHLDIEAVEYLENFLPTFKGSIWFITHDRVFLENMAKRIVELDRGRLYSFSGKYSQYLEDQQARFDTEDKHNALFDKNLAAEEVWIRKGIKARRTRNEGRVRDLEALRKVASERRVRQKSGNLVTAQSKKSGKMIIEAKDIHFEYDGRVLIDDFSTTIMRGDKIGILGPNGCGKSTLLNTLLGKIKPTSGSVREGANLEIAYFDQLRDQLDETKTVEENVSGGSEFLDINGQRMHVYSYLKQYLFTSERVRDKVAKLSGGERNRVLLAKILSKPCNVLVLDEPTNDLDVQTLELLEELLTNYKGTLMLVSHDRAFINNIVTSTIAFEGNGVVNEYVGGYDDWLTQRKTRVSEKPAKKVEVKPQAKAKKAEKSGLSYMQEKRLKALPAEIEALEKGVAELHELIAQPTFYQDNTDGAVRVKTQELADLESQLSNLYAEWDELESKQV